VMLMKRENMDLIKNDNARLPSWTILVHGKTSLKFLNFYAVKNCMVEPTLEHFCVNPVNVVRFDKIEEFSSQC
jgi:hypothetical protein